LVARRAIVGQRDEQMIDVTRLEFRREPHCGSGEGLAIPSGERTTPARPARQQRQARAQNCRLQFVEPRVDAWLQVTILIRLPAVAKTPDALGYRAIVRHHRATVAERAEILRRVDAE